MRTEQAAKDKLNPVHIKCISLMLIAIVSIGVGVVYLRVVLVPFILAIFFMFLLEPLLFGLLWLSRLNWCKKGANLPGQGAENCGVAGAELVGTISLKVWSLLSVTVCLLTLLSGCGFIVYYVVQAIHGFPWSKYTSSEKFKLLLDVFPKLGKTPEEFDIEKMVPWLLQGPIFDALDLALSFISQAFLMLLFLAFLLANDVHSIDSDDFFGILKKIRMSVRRYIRIKTFLAAVVSFVSGAFLWRMKVDMFFVFATATFVLYFIPHVGNMVAVLAPLPIVFLDPRKTLADLATAFIVPFAVHQLAINLIEPKLLASSLDLHPIVVLLSLAFWSTVWGAVGAVLSVPLTAVARLVLLEVDHPYVKPVVWFLRGDASESTNRMRTYSNESPKRMRKYSNESPLADREIVPTNLLPPSVVTNMRRRTSAPRGRERLAPEEAAERRREEEAAHQEEAEEAALIGGVAGDGGSSDGQGAPSHTLPEAPAVADLRVKRSARSDEEETLRV